MSNALSMRKQAMLDKVITDWPRDTPHGGIFILANDFWSNSLKSLVARAAKYLIWDAAPAFP